VGIDPGTRRIGVAVSDPTGMLASPYEVVERSPQWVEQVRRIVEEVEAVRVVVGLPLSLSGAEGPAAAAARDDAAELAQSLEVPVELFDERLTTVSAHRSMRDMRMKADARKRVVDKVAAAVMLQSWLESRR
jgi:putative Holliday junction resolvase